MDLWKSSHQARNFIFLRLKMIFQNSQKFYFLRHKSEIIEKLRAFCLGVENLFNRKIKEIHNDGGKEFKNKKVGSFPRSTGFKHTINVPTKYRRREGK